MKEIVIGLCVLAVLVGVGYLISLISTKVLGIVLFTVTGLYLAWCIGDFVKTLLS